MPHIKIYYFEESSIEEKQSLIVDDVLNLVRDRFGLTSDSVSVHLIPVPSDQWEEHVVNPEILPNWADLALEPGYV